MGSGLVVQVTALSCLGMSTFAPPLRSMRSADEGSRDDFSGLLAGGLRTLFPLQRLEAQLCNS